MSNTEEILLDSAIVQVSQHGAPPENASRLVWWLCRMALLQMGFKSRPEIGDTVVEVTHVLGLAKKRLGLLSAVGELIKIEKDDQRGTLYTIRTIEGKEQRWENAEMVTIEKP